MIEQIALEIKTKKYNKTKFADHCDDCEKKINIKESFFKGFRNSNDECKVVCEICIQKYGKK